MILSKFFYNKIQNINIFKIIIFIYCSNYKEMSYLKIFNISVINNFITKLDKKILKKIF